MPKPTADFLRVLIDDVQTWGATSFGAAAGVLLAAFTFWGLACAAMSTLDSYIMTASQTFFVDIANYRNQSTLVQLDASDSDKELLTLLSG